MSQAIAWFCDHVMDEFGSTCPDRIFVEAPSVDAGRILATQRGWTLAGNAGRDLCPRHGGRLYRLQLAPPNNVQPIRRPDQVSTPLLDNVSPFPSRPDPDDADQPT
jgi:hypothetical protein